MVLRGSSATPEPDRVCLATHPAHAEGLGGDEPQAHLVVSDIVGKTGMAILKAILAGRRDPVELAKLRDQRWRHPGEEIAKALVGNWRAEHLLALKQAVELYEFYHSKIAECDRAIDDYLGRLPNRPGENPLESRPQVAGKGQ